MQGGCKSMIMRAQYIGDASLCGNMLYTDMGDDASVSTYVPLLAPHSYS